MLILHQFAASHFNEKVRWALDYKGLEHQRETYLPGPHVPVIKKMSGGSSSTPLLKYDGGCISGSAKIVDWLETHYPEPALYPSSSKQRAQAQAWQARFDNEVGPATRAILFNVLLNEPDYMCATFSEGKPLFKRIGFRAMFPAAKPMIAKANGVNPANIKISCQITNQALNDVAEAVAKTGYLVGSSFTVADLAVASLLAPLTNVHHSDMRRIDPMPESVREFIAQWQDHPSIQWVHELYKRHRATAG